MLTLIIVFDIERHFDSNQEHLGLLDVPYFLVIYVLINIIISVNMTNPA